MRAVGYSANEIRSTDILRSGGSEKASIAATLVLTSKDIASKVYEHIRGDTAGGPTGDALIVTPIRKLGTRSKDEAAGFAEFAGRIKLTWADGEATGDAKVFFRSAHDANTFTRQARGIFNSTTLKAFAIGETGANTAELPVIGRASQSKAKQPKAGVGAVPHALAPTKKEIIAGGPAFRLVFDTDAIDAMTLEQQSRLRYGVSIKGGLAASMDEYELVEVVKRVVPAVGYAKIARKPVTMRATPNDMEHQVRFRRMLPLLSCLEETSVHTDYVDQATRRAGVVVFCRDLPHLVATYEMARSSPLWSELEKPHGQPIRMELEHSYTTTVHVDLFRCFREQVAAIITFARMKGVMYQETKPSTLAAASSAAKNMVTMKFLGEMRVLQRVKSKLDACFEVEKVESPDIHVLFTVIARRKVSALLDKHIEEDNARLRYFIRWITKRNEYCVYGDAPGRHHAIAGLHKLIKELKSLDVLDRVLRIYVRKDPKTGVKAAKVSIKQWMKSAPSAKALYSYVVQSNQCVYVAGSTSQVDGVVQALEKDGLMYKPRAFGSKPSGSSKPDCGICYCPVDEPTITLPICNHTFDFGYLQNMIQPATCMFPLKCPAPNCDQVLRVDDASRILNDSDAFLSLVETAALNYAVNHKSEAILCPKLGCNILSTASFVGSASAIGSKPIYCGECRESYCVDCSAVSGKPICRHPNLTCDQFKSRQVSPQIVQHLRVIQEQILNVLCPHCRSVFLDFTGCTSVQCGNATCGHHFCANCLTFSSASSNDTHHHVARCPSNPNPASSSGVKGYFVSEEQLIAAHRSLRKQKLTVYFTERLTNDAMRCAVYRQIQKHLEDLGVDLPVKLQAAHAANDARYMLGGEDENEEAKTPIDSVLRGHVQHIREQLLNLRCPKCSLMFVDFDFDTCAALTCANPNCAGGICAYCLAQCGSDAHKHVSECVKNPNRPYYFTTEETFRAMQKERREESVAKYLTEIVRRRDGDEMVTRVMTALEDDFRGLGLDVAGTHN